MPIYFAYRSAGSETPRKTRTLSQNAIRVMIANEPIKVMAEGLQPILLGRAAGKPLNIRLKVAQSGHIDTQFSPSVQ